MYISLQITATLSLLLEPFIPFSMKTLREWLKIGEFGWKDAGRNDLLTPGHTILNPGLLFEKIEDDQIERQISKLMQTKIDNAAAAAVVAPGKDSVTFDDFTKVDLRTATILEAEKVPKTTKLMKLKVDTGLDIRTIVSGIAEHYTAEELPGLQVSVIVNLEPRTIKGIESKGMILLAEETDGKLVFVSPVRKTENGSVIK
jgi:methionyl-tRNA synthetase